MSYHLDISAKAEEDIVAHRKAGNKAVLNKILVLFNELTEHPFTGTGKPEQLKYALSSRGPEGLTVSTGWCMK
jgi:toxin YoeB